MARYVIHKNEESMREFLEYCERGDPLKDKWDEDDLASSLCWFIQKYLEDKKSEEQSKP